MLARMGSALVASLMAVGAPQAQAASSSAVAFQVPYVAYNTGHNPRAVAVGDLNRDGLPDLVTADFSGGSVSFVYGVARGLFRLTGSMVPGLNPRDIALVDFNGDGILDVITCNFGGHELQILTGTDAGGFYTDQNPQTGNGPAALTIGDFDRDGRADVATANAEDSTVSVLLHKQGLWERHDLRTGAFPLGIASGDINGDLIADLVTANAFGNSIAIFIGEGDGTFEEPRYVAVGQYPAHVAIGELDGDTRQDIVVANHLSNTLTLVLSGSGVRQIPAGVLPIASAIGDIDGDGTNEVVSSAYGERDLWVFDNSGTGSLSVSRKLPTPIGPVGATLADVNDDGRLDVVSTSQVISAVAVSLGNGDGTFGHEPATFATARNPRVLGVLDSGGESRVDLVVAGRTNQVQIFEGDGTGAFVQTGSLMGPEGAEDIAMGDVTRDGLPDVLTAQPDGQSVAVYRRISMGALAAPAVLSVGSPVTSVAPSHEGAALYATVCAEPGSLVVVKSDGVGTLVRSSAMAVMDCPWDAIANDFDDDGLEDVVLVRPGYLSVLWGLGDREFDGPVTLRGGVYNFAAVGLGDFNQDGRLDIVAATRGSRDESAVHFALAQPGRSFDLLAVPALTVARGAMNVAVGDLDGDGIDDIATASPVDKMVTVVLSRGGGPPKNIQHFGTSLTPRWVQIADVTGDGNPDLLFLSEPDNVVAVAPQVAPPRPVHVAIDLIPQRDNNVVELQSHGLLPVAVFGSATFEVKSIEPGSVQVAGAVAEIWRLHDLDDDGYVDAEYRVRSNALGLSPSDTIVTLTGRRLDGRSFEGSDPVRVRMPAGRSAAIAVADADPFDSVPFAIHSTSSRASEHGLEVSFATPHTGACVLEAFDVIGRRVAVHRMEVTEPGLHSVGLGRNLAMGLYFVRLRQGEMMASSRAVVLR